MSTNYKNDRHQRMAIYVKDVEIITGKKRRAASSLLRKIRTKLGKAKHQIVTIKELGAYLGIEEDFIKKK